MRETIKPYNGGQWTQARMNSFIKGALRQASIRWPPINQVRKNARTERGVYRCAGYKRRAHKVPASLPPLPGNTRRIKNNIVDHINPVISPKKGFEGWDQVISRMFCEVENLQLLCHDCNKRKTADERKDR